MARLVYIPQEVVESTRLKERLAALNLRKKDAANDWEKHIEELKAIRLRHDVARETENYYANNAGRFADHQLDLGEKGGMIGRGGAGKTSVRFESGQPAWTKKIYAKHVGIASDRKGRWWAWSEKGEARVNGRKPIGVLRLCNNYVIQIGAEFWLFKRELFDSVQTAIDNYVRLPNPFSRNASVVI